MALKAVLESVDELPEAVRGFYAEKDGKHVLQVEPVEGFALENVEGLKSTLSKEMTKRKQLEKDIVRFKDIDPDRAREALAKLEELGNIDPGKDADKIINERVEAAKRQLLEKQGEELRGRDTRIGSLTKTVENLMIDQVATVALAEAKGAVELLLPHVQRQTRVREDANGGFTVEVVDKDGNARIGNSKGDPMTIKDLVQEMRQSKAFGTAFEGSGHSGTGMGPNNGGGGNPQVKSKADVYKHLGANATKEQARKARTAFVEANGGTYEAYNKLPGAEPIFK